MKHSRAQIVATIGPSSAKPDIFKAMVEHQLDVVRLNFSWGDLESRTKQIKLVHNLEKESNRRIPIIIDLPGPRIQGKVGHTYDKGMISCITEEDKKFIQFAAEQGVDYIALSFVGDADDVTECRKIMKSFNGKQKIIAKIERAIALDNLDQIIKTADAIMVARGDLGNEVPLEDIPFIQERIIKAAKAAKKPVITATGMLLSMVNSPTPSRAEVTDVANAILQGSDAVMLSEESAIGKYPIEAVAMMEKIVLDAEEHGASSIPFNSL